MVLLRPPRRPNFFSAIMGRLSPAFSFIAMQIFSFGLAFRFTDTSAQWAPGMSFARVDTCGSVISIAEGDQLSPHSPLFPGLIATAEGVFVLGVPGVALYNITTEVITVHAIEGADPEAVKLFLWGSAVGAVLHLRGIWPLHGSTVRLPDGTAAMFCGHSGAGKSTTVAALGQRGLACVADDVSAIQFDAQGQAWVYPGLPRTKLWGHALAQLGLAQGSQIRDGIDKYYVDLPLCNAPLRLSKLYELDAKQGGGVVVSPIQGMDRVTALLTHTYRPRFVATLGKQAAHMARAARLAPLLKMARITRPRGESTLPDIVEQVLKDCA